MKSPRLMTTALLIVLAGVVGIPVPAPAQTDLTELQAAIERNAELLAQAEALVRETNSVKARAALDAARKLHESSLSLLRFGSALRAGTTAREAREAILRAIAIARHEAKLEQDALRAMERAWQRFDQARAALDDYGGRDDGAPRKLVEEARVQLQRARDNMQEHMFEVALHLARASYDLSARALQLLKRNGVSPERVMREVNRTDNVLARIDERDLSSRPDVERLLRDARDLQQRAKQNARTDRLRLALEQTQRARGVALRILKTTGAADGHDEESVTRALQFTDEVLERSLDYARQHGLDNARRQLQEAERTQLEAKERFEGGDLEGAMRLTLHAREMAKRSVRGVDRPVDRGSVEAALRRTDEALTRLRAAVSESDDAQAQSLYERAAQRQAGAWEALETRQPRKALALTKVARDLAEKAMRLLGEDDG